MSSRETWSREEIAILLYFRSRCISYRSLYLLLLRRGFHRTLKAIERKTWVLVRQCPQLKSSTDQWNLGVVDCWIDRLVGSHEVVSGLVHLGAEDAEVIALTIERTGNAE
ncbi:hypothetical protein N7468_009882 [Penicillium chermesinum]|uniref:Uncharacterized protein n=1 Tax=Penicillium chermesinum TaxID=63820 RepID=A0A9W9NBK7_9EURO|nr:uncharacterized protein N7468_009849 [Penicillium chermesinum]XP_058325745.1 uncharacterized protein N7468_009882 [Penicillium chermesinum]KAJ5216841.1 hypothetical protein N7468_009849 [Penicillium chermesinum]KAJ5216874.1 hypothetical protein N7468_009882 [Penicillium chermesinum]KAJ6171510.1 hypothetical protein N7470_000577 [Penicillium chermesinum]KAJ6171540.1 hypothetical protein N7470_000607 [Penicillium chermesinum]